MKKTICFILCLLVCLYSCIAFAEIPPCPDFNGYVYDYANVINASDELLINEYAQAAQSLNVGQVITLTVASLDGIDIGDYATDVINTWGIGSSEKNDGVLILLAPNERQVWAGTGSGIDEILTSDIIDDLIDTRAIDLLASNQFSAGITALAKNICIKLALLFSPLFDDPALIADIA